MTVKTYMTAAVADKMNASDTFNQFVLDSLNRHLSGDWGDVSEADAADNAAESLNAMSAYIGTDGVKIWVKQDYNIITVLFPDEY